MSSNRLEKAEFANNTEPRCAVVLALDTSSSMGGQPIDELNQGLHQFASDLKKVKLTMLRVELAIITFGGSVRAIDVSSSTGASIPFDPSSAFTSPDRFVPPVLNASGDTPMGEAVHRSVALIQGRKAIYKQNAIDYFRPWIFLITDGYPTDSNWESAANLVRQEEARKGVLFYAVGVEGADIQQLSKFSAQHPPLKLKGLAFSELFQWLSGSLDAVAQSNPGEMTPLPPVTWGQVDTSI